MKRLIIPLAFISALACSEDRNNLLSITGPNNLPSTENQLPTNNIPNDPIILTLDSTTLKKIGIYPFPPYGSDTTLPSKIDSVKIGAFDIYKGIFEYNDIVYRIGVDFILKTPVTVDANLIERRDSLLQRNYNKWAELGVGQYWTSDIQFPIGSGNFPTYWYGDARPATWQDNFALRYWIATEVSGFDLGEIAGITGYPLLKSITDIKEGDVLYGAGADAKYVYPGRTDLVKEVDPRNLDGIVEMLTGNEVEIYLQ